MREQDERRLRAVLREQAGRHQPDRDAMLQRIAATRTERRRPALIRLRPLAAAAGVAAVLGISIAGVRLAGNHGGTEHVAAPTRQPGPATVAPTPSPAASRPSAPSRLPSHAPSSRPPSNKTSSPPPPPAGQGHSSSADAYLSSHGEINPGSNAYWTQSDVVLSSGQDITALDVTITVKKTAQVVGTDKWSTVARQKMTLTMTTHDDTVVFHFVLNDGETLPAGEYTFSAQFNHAQDRSAKSDTYAARTTAGGTEARVTGGF
ncbi:hypothetical protein [Actinoplanes sp. N902-109]|uniref:hypothetical protein n=1 Tax=Actinoplanes sp. (strain N902-109) TaxID=649831 RepID=UPI00032943C4|nr:hypothetical protein [Actinoplanes sp. N902-109]AGL17862.1 hypothetical protein L083_4352 [Actinoplanes sp. N902-109]